MRPTHRLLPRRTLRTYTTHPPPARPFQPGPPPPRPEPKTPTSTTTTTAAPSHPNPRAEPPNPARGAAASLRAATEGVLDPRYRAASRRVIAIICAVPIFLVTSWVLFQRRFMGVEQKHFKGREGAVAEGVEVGEGK